MEIKSVLLNLKDNVVTTTANINKGDVLKYFKDNEILSVTVLENIPSYHKVAIKDIEKGTLVIKYGEIIGVATEDIKEGQHVSHKNIDSLPRNYEEELK